MSLSKNPAAAYRRLLTGLICLALCLASLPPVSAQAVTITVGSYADLTAAIATAGSGDTIALSADITLGAGQVIVLTNKTLTLTSANPSSPATIKRGGALNNAPMLHIAAGAANITIKNLTLDGGAVWDKHGNGAVNSGVHAQFSIINSLGGNTITLGAGAVAQNNEINFANWSQSCAGGGLFIQGAKLVIDGGVVRYNCANGTANDGGGLTKAVFAHGGGVLCVSSTTAATSLTLNSGSISDNWCKQPYAQNSYGGNVEAWRFNAGTVDVAINGGDISRGYAGQGGGLYLNGADFLMTGGKIDGNSSQNNGGGIIMRPYNTAYSGSLSITGGSIVNNSALGDTASASGYGGGLYLERVANASITGGSFSGNQSKEGGGAIGITGGSAVIGGSAAITGNTANGWAGGIYLSLDPATMAGGALTLNDTVKLSGNTSVANSLSNGVYHGGTSLTIASDKLTVPDFIWLRQASTNYVTLTTPLTSGIFNLTTAAADSADGRIVVKPGGALSTLTAYAAHFTHNMKGVIPSGNNLVLGGFGVTFNLQGHGTQIPGQAAAYGAKVTKPADPAEAGWAFGGWYKEAACATPWRFDVDVVTGNLVLFAQWKPAVGAPPTTGDNMQTWLWITLLALSASALLFSVAGKRLKKHE